MTDLKRSTPSTARPGATRRKLRGLRNVLLIAALSMGAAYAANCAGPGDELGVDPVEARRVLDSIAQRVVVPTLEQFALAAGELESAAQAYRSTGSEEDRLAAQAAWRAAMTHWERVELMQLGPAGPSTEAGGMDRRDEIYSWPTTNRCRVDQELVAESYTDAASFATELVNVRGLDAMEYLLFTTGAENACSELSPINMDGTWAALGQDTIDARRAAYAATLAALVREQADALYAAWSPADGDFAAQLATAGDGSDTYASSQEALNDVLRVMFYLDAATKDLKLGQPAGMFGCAEVSCPELVESLEAAMSKEHVVENLRAFQQLFHGGPDAATGVGFDDLLNDLGEEELATRMTDNIAAAITAVESIDGTLQDAVQTDPQPVIDAQSAVRLITSDLKGAFVTVLSLRIPAEGAGDAD